MIIWQSTLYLEIAKSIRVGPERSADAECVDDHMVIYNDFIIAVCLKVWSKRRQYWLNALNNFLLTSLKH